MTSSVPTWLPIAISAAALGIAMLSLGWNIYRDVILKARVVVSFSVKWLNSSGRTDEVLMLTAVNHGPGKVRFAALATLKNAPLWRCLLRRQEWFGITPDWSSPFGTKLPASVEVGEEIRLVFPYDEECFLSQPVTDIGIMDSFGRYHLARRRDVSEAVKQFRKDFVRRNGQWTRRPV